MAVFRWFDGNQGVYGYSDFIKGYDIASDTYSGKGSDGTITLDWRGNQPFDPTTHPWQIEVDFVDATKSKKVFRSGTIEEVRFLNADGDTIVQATGLDTPLSAMIAYLTQFDNGFWDFLVAGGHRFIGSEDGSGPDQSWNGEDIETGGGDDIVFGNGGDDYIVDAGRSDVYYGGNKDTDDGIDTVSYLEFFRLPHFWTSGREVSGIVARLDKGKVLGPDGYTDKVFGIEEIRGTFLDDKFIGDDNNNFFYGLNGRDVFNGKGGFDTLRYDRDNLLGGNDGVTVDFSKGKAVDGFGAVDKFKDMEAALGTDGKDTFIGSDQSETFTGRGGNDTFMFGKNVKSANDMASGGDGADTFILSSDAFRRVEITDFEIGTDTLTIEGAKKRNVEFESDEFNNLLITYKGNLVVLTNRGGEEFGFGDLG